jgi:hypothetical protein
MKDVTVLKEATVMNVVHRERYPILNAQGGIKRVVEEEWSEPADVHAKHRDAIAAIAQQGMDDLQNAMTFAKADIERLDAERQREHDRVLELEHQVAVEQAMRRNEEGRLAEYAAAARDAAFKLLELPAEGVIDVANLRQLERVIRATEPAPNRILWSLPSEAKR